MKVLLYFEGQNIISKSGIGQAMKHQMAALDSAGIAYTTNPDEDYDNLHLNTIGPCSSALLRSARRKGKKIVVHAHSTEEDFRNSFLFSNSIAPVFKRRLIQIYSQADHLITPTPYSKKLLESYGISIPIHALSNGIDLDRFHYSEAKIRDFRTYFQLRPDEKVVISVGLFFKRKGIDDFVEVARRLPHIRFIWFGHVPLYSIPRDVRQLVIRNHPANVLFPGYISGSVLEGAYCGADAFFFPSHEETEGIVVLEALASYQQIILRDIPVYEPWLKDQVNCFKGHNVDEFTRLVEASTEHRLPDLRTAGRITAELRSIPIIGKRLREVYEQLLQE